MEDEASVAKLIQVHLQGLGFSVAIAEDGTKGLVLSVAHSFMVDSRSGPAPRRKASSTEAAGTDRWTTSAMSEPACG